MRLFSQLVSDLLSFTKYAIYESSEVSRVYYEVLQTKHGTSQACGIKHMVPMSPDAGGPHVWHPTDLGSDSEIEQRTLTSNDFQNL